MFVYDLKMLPSILGRLAVAIFLMTSFFMCSPKIYNPPSIRLDQTTDTLVLKSLFGNDDSSTYKLKPGDVLEISYIQIYPFRKPTATQGPTFSYLRIPFRKVNEGLKEYEKLFLTLVIGTNLEKKLDFTFDSKKLDQQLVKVWNNFIDNAKIFVDRDYNDNLSGYGITNIDNIFQGTELAEKVNMSNVRNDSTMIRFYREPFITNFYHLDSSSGESSSHAKENYYKHPVPGDSTVLPPAVVFFNSLTINGVDFFSPEGAEQNWTFMEWLESEALYYISSKKEVAKYDSSIIDIKALKLQKLPKLNIDKKRSIRPHLVKIPENDKEDAVLKIKMDNNVPYLLPEYKKDKTFNFLKVYKIEEPELNKVYPSMIDKVFLIKKIE